MSLTFASNLTKMIDAGLGGEVIAPDTSVAIGYRMQYHMVSGPVASWNDPEGGLPINIAAEFGPIQAGTGVPSPENVRPISGRQSATVWRSGGNIWDEETVPEIINNSGEFVPSTNAFRSKNPIPVTPGQKLYIVNGSNTYIYMKFYNSDGGYVDSPINNRNAEITVPNVASIAYMYFSVGSEYGKTYKHDIAINYPSTVTDYNTSISVTVQLGQTVYGGRLNVTSGVLKVDWANIASYDGETLPGEWISDRDVYSPGATPTTGAQVCYKLAEPLTVQLSPQTINSLLGQNNVWSDAGDVSITWKEKLYTEGY